MVLHEQSRAYWKFQLPWELHEIAAAVLMSYPIWLDMVSARSLPGSGCLEA